METLPEDRNTAMNNLCTFSIQSSQCTIKTTQLTIGMVTQQFLFQPTQQQVGSPPHRLICNTDKHQTPPVHDMETLSISNSNGRSQPDMAWTQKHLCLPPMESPTNSPTEDSDGESHSNSDHTTLDISTMVPYNTKDGGHYSSSHPMTRHTATTGQSTEYS